MIRNGMRRTAIGIAMSTALALGILMSASAPAQAQYRGYDDRNGYGGYDGHAQWSNERTKDYAFKLAYHNAYTDARRDYDGRSRSGYKDMPGYHNDSNAYRSWMGNRNDYRSAYRKGYEAGFKDSIESRPRRYDRDDVERVLGGDLKQVYGNHGDYRDDPYGDDRGDRDRDWNNQGRDRDHDWNNQGRDRDHDWNDRRRDNRSETYRIAQQNGYRDGLRTGQEDRNRSRASGPDRSDRFRNAQSGYRSGYGDRELYRQAYREGFRQGYAEGYRSGRGRFTFPRPF